jgi:hypothetical protein
MPNRAMCFANLIRACCLAREADDGINHNRRANQGGVQEPRHGITLKSA